MRAGTCRALPEAMLPAASTLASNAAFTFSLTIRLLSRLAAAPPFETLAMRNAMTAGALTPNLIAFVAILTQLVFVMDSTLFGVEAPFSPAPSAELSGKGLVAGEDLPSSTARPSDIKPAARRVRSRGTEVFTATLSGGKWQRRRGVGHKEKIKDANHKVKGAVKKWSEKAADELVVKEKDGKAESEGPKSDAQRDSV